MTDTINVQWYMFFLFKTAAGGKKPIDNASVDSLLGNSVCCVWLAKFKNGELICWTKDANMKPQEFESYDLQDILDSDLRFGQRID